MNTPNSTPFGQSDAERINYVRAMFSRIAGSYDFCNRFLSGRRDVAWRKRMVREMDFSQTARYLDLATGSGDVAIRCARSHRGVHVVAIDFVHEMVLAAKRKVRTRGLDQAISLSEGDATHIPFPDHAFDCVGMAFGIRNIPDRNRALSEMVRVAVPGGKVLVLELTTPENRFLHLGYCFLLRRVLPGIAGLFSDDRGAYDYLGESIVAFPTKEEFLEKMRAAGIQDSRAIALTLGTCHLFVGAKKGAIDEQR
ncbi:MAG: ubiquinone/menaquinone biosynthesis methyltransferase [Candidatus Latescibacterota bacterium]